MRQRRKPRFVSASNRRRAMLLWTRKKPAEFSDILAGLDRREPREKDEPVFEERRAPQSRARIVPETASPPRNRLREVLTGLSFAMGAWRWPFVGQSQIHDPSAAYEDDGSTEPLSAPDAVRLEIKVLLSEDEEIAEELGLAKAFAKTDLERIRREFAKKNHPDLCPPPFRMRASRRMSIANMLIDARLKEKRQQA
jgi:hypothetical protein